MASVLTEKTMVPITVIIVLSGGIFWLSSMFVRNEANAANIIELKNNIKSEREEDRSYIEKRLDRIEGKLDALSKK